MRRFAVCSLLVLLLANPSDLSSCGPFWPEPISQEQTSRIAIPKSAFCSLLTNAAILPLRSDVFAGYRSATHNGIHWPIHGNIVAELRTRQLPRGLRLASEYVQRRRGGSILIGLEAIIYPSVIVRVTHSSRHAARLLST